MVHDLLVKAGSNKYVLGRIMDPNFIWNRVSHKSKNKKKTPTVPTSNIQRDADNSSSSDSDDSIQDVTFASVDVGEGCDVFGNDAGEEVDAILLEAQGRGDALLEATIRVSSTHNNNHGGDEHDDIEAQEEDIDDGYNGDNDLAQNTRPNAGTFIRDGIKIKKEPLHPLAMVDITAIGIEKFKKRNYREKSALTK